MCGRFTLFHDVATIARAFNVPVPESLKVTPRYNVAPTQEVLSVVHDEAPQLTLLRWGLIPSWAKEESIGLAEVLACVTMQVVVRDHFTMIAAPVQGDVDGIPKGSHCEDLLQG